MSMYISYSTHRTDLYSPPRLLLLLEVAHAKPDSDRGGDDCSETGGERLRVEARGRRGRLRNVSEREELLLEGKGLEATETRVHTDELHTSTGQKKRHQTWQKQWQKEWQKEWLKR